MGNLAELNLSINDMILSFVRGNNHDHYTRKLLILNFSFNSIVVFQKREMF